MWGRSRWWRSRFLRVIDRGCFGGRGFDTAPLQGACSTGWCAYQAVEQAADGVGRGVETPGSRCVGLCTYQGAVWWSGPYVPAGGPGLRRDDGEGDAGMTGKRSRFRHRDAGRGQDVLARDVEAKDMVDERSRCVGSLAFVRESESFSEERAPGGLLPAGTGGPGPLDAGTVPVYPRRCERGDGAGVPAPRPMCRAGPMSRRGTGRVRSIPAGTRVPVGLHLFLAPTSGRVGVEDRPVRRGTRDRRGIDLVVQRAVSGAGRVLGILACAGMTGEGARASFLWITPTGVWRWS